MLQLAIRTLHWGYYTAYDAAWAPTLCVSLAPLCSPVSQWPELLPTKGLPPSTLQLPRAGLALSLTHHSAEDCGFRKVR